jgi:putative ABC transport system permease protein
MPDLTADLRYAARTLRRSPSFTLTAIAAIALGIGSSTAVFSVVNKVLLEPLPYPEPDRLVQLMVTSALGDQSVATIPQFILWRDLTHIFRYVAAYDIGGPGVSLTEGDRSEVLTAAHVSADYFRLFGARVKLGRTFSPQEDQPDGPRTVVISHALWRRRFGGDTTIVGRKIPLEHQWYKVSGVLAPGFVTDSAVDVWFPLQADPATADHVGRVRVVARMLSGVTLQQAKDGVDSTLDIFRGNYRFVRLLYQTHFTAMPLRDAVVGNVRPALFLLIGAVGFVVLISCANVANLLLARSTRRARDLALRAALGAQRKRIIWELLTESVLLAMTGGAVGLALGYFGVRALLAISPSDIHASARMAPPFRSIGASSSSPCPSLY